MAIPVAIAYSPKTQTDGITLIGATVIVIDNTINEGIASFPDASVTAPGEAVFHIAEHFNTEDPADYETITYTERDVASNELRGVTRAVEGTAREWAAGTWIASYTSSNAWNGMREMAMLAGFKNTIINGNFNINQRGHTSGGTLAAGSYGHDRWKAGTGGCNYTFSTTANKTTVTIPSTRELLQIIEGENLVSGDYTLSWEGTAEGKIGAGAYAVSPITASVTGGANLTITFGAGTVANVQFEQGSVASSFEQRPIGLELFLCKRYYLPLNSNVMRRADLVTANVIQFTLMFTPEMRDAPTLTSGTEGTDWRWRLIDTTAQTGFALSVEQATADKGLIRGTKAAHGITDGHLQVQTNGGVALSAEL